MWILCLEAKKKTREEKCIQKLFLLLHGIRFTQGVREGPDGPPILWIIEDKYVKCKQALRQLFLFVRVIGTLGLDSLMGLGPEGLDLLYRQCNDFFARTLPQVSLVILVFCHFFLFG